MAVSGKVVLYTTPDNKRVILAVKNDGNQTLGVTNNYFPDKSSAETLAVHDDNTRYGHGLECMPGNDSWSFQEFPIGGKYHNYTITNGGFLRVGLRGACWAVAQIPAAGKTVELDFGKDFHWYNGQSAAASNHQLAGMAGYKVNGMHTQVGGANSTIKTLMGALTAQKSGVAVNGKVIVEAHEGEGGVLSHWTVRFENLGKTPFIGTAVFKDAKKNDGIGLESMGVPNKGSAAEQRIEANGNYGVVAQPGLMMRLGVRGYGFTEVALPQGGKTALDLASFEVDTSQINKKFFDKAEVEKKQQEKLDKVRFFEAGKPINDELKPVSYVGEEGLAHANFDPPQLIVRSVKNTEETPGGGWLIEMRSTLPEKDPKGRVGFVGTLKLGPTGADPLQLPPKKFPNGGNRNVWFLPRSAQLGAFVAEPGAELRVGTRGMGWQARVPLPKPGKVVDSADNLDVWSWRPDQYTRDQLSLKFINQCQLGPDEKE